MSHNFRAIRSLLTEEHKKKKNQIKNNKNRYFNKIFLSLDFSHLYREIQGIPTSEIDNT